MHERVTKSVTNGLAIVVILGFIAVIANSLRVYRETSEAYGPTVLATDAAGKIYTSIAATLHVLDATGNHEQSIPLPELGLHGATLTDLLALPDGRLLIGSSDAVKIRSCDLAARRCTPFIQSGSQPVSAFKMAWDAQRQRLIAVDGERHRILVYDRDGVLTLKSSGGNRGLQFPNTVLLTADDLAIIADTNQHRLVALDAETLSVERREIPLSNPSGNLRRIWPTDFAITTDQHCWVILDNDLLEDGDVLLFDAAGRPLQRLALPGDWDPVKLLARPHDVLLAGYSSVDLVSISLDGKAITAFGDALFRDKLAEIRARRTASDRWWQQWIWLAIAPLLVLAGIAAWLDRNQRSVTANPPPAAVASDILPETGYGVHWLEPDPKIVRLWQFSRWLVYFMGVLLFAPAIYIVWWMGLEESAGFIALLLAGGIAFMAMLVTGLRTLSQGRLGVTRDQVVLGAAGKPHRHYYPRQLVYSRRFISAGDVTVYLRTGKVPVFDPGEIRSHLEPLLKAARKLNPLQGYIYLLQQGDRLAWVNTLGIACLGGLYLYAKPFME